MSDIANQGDQKCTVEPLLNEISTNTIKAAIASAGTNQSAIAKFLGVSVTTVSKVVNKNARSAKIELELEKIVGKGCFGPARKPGRSKAVWTGQITKATA